MATILIVDDMKEIQALISEVLGHQGHDIHTASNSVEAFAMIPRIHPDLIMTDIYNGSVSGLEVVKVAAQQVPAIPVIVISGSGGSRAAMDAGAVAFIAKPFKVDQLLQSVSRVMRDRQGQGRTVG